MSTKAKQSINFFSLTMIVVSLVIGMGIFKTPATIAAKSGTPLIFFSAWIIGGIIALFGFLLMVKIVPETKGKSLEELEKELAR